ncbi:MAG TPA: response regulator [Kofleriaceae bacterium]
MTVSADSHSLRARVLIVDDEPDIACTMADALELMGYITYVAHDATSALALTEHFAPDVSLLDIGLPDLDGYELAERLLARHGKNLVVIAVTAYGDDDHRDRAVAAGFDAYLVKPTPVTTVIATIQRLLGVRGAPTDRAHVQATR